MHSLRKLSALLVFLLVFQMVPLVGGPNKVQAAFDPAVVQPSIASGDKYTLILGIDGTVKVMGLSTNGALGLGTTTQTLIPTIIPALVNVKQIATYAEASYALLQDGNVKVWGTNWSGQLGTGNTTASSRPISIPLLSNVKQIVAGFGFAFAVLNDGTVKAWGYNADGQLGFGNTVNTSTPTIIPNLTNVKQMGAGQNFAIALLYDGTVKTWGSSIDGQLGLGNTRTQYSPTLVTSLTGVKQVSAGRSHAMALLNDGTVKSWGYNVSGELGQGNTSATYFAPTLISGINNVKQISSGNNHSGALLTDGTAKVWGYNGTGELGQNHFTTRLSPTMITQTNNITHLVTGHRSSFAVLSDYSIRSFGLNTTGQLGIGHITNSSVPVLVANTQAMTIPLEVETFDPITTDQIVSGIKIYINGREGSTLSVKLYKNSDTITYQQKAITLGSNGTTVLFEPIDKFEFNNGSNSLKFRVSDGIQMIEKIVTFNIANTSSQNTLVIRTTTNSITATGSSLANTATLADNPYRWTIETSVSAWLPKTSSAAHTVTGLLPNTKHAVIFEVKNSLGNISAESSDVYTLSASPVLYLINTATNSANLGIQDTNPIYTKYQIAVGDKFVSQTGTLISQPTWITVPIKQILIVGLTPSKSYSFLIKAINENGVETDLSAPVQVGPPEALPAIPTNIKIFAKSNKVTLFWNPVFEATAYEIKIDESLALINNGMNISYDHANLTPETVHTYRVRSVKDGINGEWSELLSIQTLVASPITPSNIVATSTSMTSTINWNAEPGANTYEVEFDGEKFAKQITTTFKQIDLLPGSQHTYRVRAINAGGASPWSVMSTIMTMSTPPSQPTVTEATYSNTSVTINWTEVEDANQYEVEADGLVFDNGYANFTEISGLLPATSHQYRIRAVNQIGESPWSDPITIATHHLATPSIIQDVIEDTSIQIAWNIVSGATSYEVEINGVVLGTSTYTFLHPNLTPETIYVYRIRAINATGNSAWSSAFSLTTLPLKPAAPNSINAIAAKVTITLVWEPVEGATAYDVELDGEVVVDNFDALTYSDIELEPFTQHHYRVRAKNEAVAGEWSPQVMVYTLPDKPGMPTNVAVTSAGSIVTLTWNQDPTAIGYDIQINGQTVNVGKKTEYKHRRIALGSEHRYRIRIRNSAGIGEWSGLIINNTLTAKLTKNKTVDLGLVTKDIVDFSKYELTVTYDPKAIDVVDLSMLTGSVELSTGRITGTDITITAFTPGKITFVSDKAINPDESWTGVINSIKFKARVSGGSSITYSVITNP